MDMEDRYDPRKILQVLETTEPGSTERVEALDHLFRLLRDRYAHTGRVEDLEEAIRFFY